MAMKRFIAIKIGDIKRIVDTQTMMVEDWQYDDIVFDSNSWLRRFNDMREESIIAVTTYWRPLTLKEMIIYHRTVNGMGEVV
jgi:hypothetical protein